MNIKQFKYVRVLAETGSFSKAADILGIAQPSLSQYIKKIETEIGLALFDRANGDVRLTDAGRVYIDAGKQFLNLEHQMEVQFSDIAEYKSGSLIIGASPYRAASMLPEITHSFQQLYPGMHLIVREGTTAELEEGMAYGDYDMALTLLPVDTRMFSYEKVMDEELLLAVPSSFPPFQTRTVQDRKYPAIDVKTLNGQGLVMLTDTQFMQRQLEDVITDYKITVKTAVIVKSLEAQIAMVRAGVGMALVPSGIEWFAATQEVRFYSFAQAFQKREVVVIWRKDRKLSRVAEDLKSIFLNVRR